MDAIKKIIHPHQQQSSNSDTTTTTTAPSHTHANAATTEALGSEPNVTGTDRQPPTHGDSAQDNNNNIKQPRAGHHHPRQPVGATGLPPNHKPREDFINTQQQQQQQHEEVGSGGPLAGAGVESGQQQLGQQQQHRVVAESGNNFPGTNPHPAHSALGNESMTGEKGSVLPGRE